MSQRFLFRALFVCNAFTLLVPRPGSAQADPQPPQSTTELESIIVTGSKRDTPYLQSDLSVTVLDRKALVDAGVRDLRDVDKLVPNVKFNAMGQLSNMFISIRGIESNPFLVNRASVYVDGIPFRELSNAVLNQVEQIEVLRGPQGTLYGANSESGLILIRTRGPGDKVEGEANGIATGHPGGQGLSADGFLAGPLGDGTLSASLALKREGDDSYLRNLTPYAGIAGHLTETYLQGRLRWHPNAAITLNALAYQLRTTAPGMFEYEYVPLDIGLYNRTYADLYNGGRRGGDFTYLNDAPKKTSELETVAGASLAWQLESGRIDAALSYRQKRDTSAGYDFDMTAAPVLAGRIHNDNRYLYSELRYSSAEEQPLIYVAGVSAYDERKNSILGTMVGPGTLRDYRLAPAQGSDGRDYSVFATASYTPPAWSKWTASLGMRFDRAQRSTRQQAGMLDLGPGGKVFYRSAELAHTFDAVLPRFSLRYDASADLTFYSSIAKGYIPGGFNLAAAQKDVINDKVLRYESETMWNKEAGFKANLWNGAGRIGGAVFHIASNNWQEIQVATDANGRPISSDYVGSDASIVSKGVEVEGEVNLGKGFSLTANAAYVDATYRDLLAAPGVNLRGNRVKLTPRGDAYLAARDTDPSGCFARIDASFTGRTALDERNRAFQPGVVVYGAQLGYETAHWRLRVFGENLLNARRFNGLIFDNLAFGRDGNYYGPLDRPRIVGVEVGYRL